MKFTTLFFDLDDTLYDHASGLWPAISARMGQYMVERLGVPKDHAQMVRKSYYETYGTTLRGLQRHHQVDSDEYLAYVHDLPLERFIQPDPGLRRLLRSLPQRKWIFTNADDQHARRVLSILDLGDLFTGVIDIRRLEYCCKPELEAYASAMRLAGEASPQRCVMFDDSPRNLAPAKKLGFMTILVGTDSPHPAADLALLSLADLPAAFPDLWAF
jgi:putative hydrolase of the HAD superfamily